MFNYMFFVGVAGTVRELFLSQFRKVVIYVSPGS